MSVDSRLVQHLLGFVCFFGAFVATSPMNASIGGDASQPNSLEPLKQWALQTGKPTVMRGVIVRAMGFPDRDIEVRERGFQMRGETLTHVLAAPIDAAHDDALFFAVTDERDGSAVVWRSSTRGETTKTVRFADGVAIQAPTATSAAAFGAEVNYFRRKMTEVADNNMQNDGTPTAPPAVSSRATPLRPQVLSSERFVLAMFPWMAPVIVGFLVYAARGSVRRSE